MHRRLADPHDTPSLAQRSHRISGSQSLYRRMWPGPGRVNEGGPRRCAGGTDRGKAVTKEAEGDGPPHVPDTSLSLSMEVPMYPPSPRHTVVAASKPPSDCFRIDQMYWILETVTQRSQRRGGKTPARRPSSSIFSTTHCRTVLPVGPPRLWGIVRCKRGEEEKWGEAGKGGRGGRKSKYTSRMPGRGE